MPNGCRNHGNRNFRRPLQIRCKRHRPSSSIHSVMGIHRVPQWMELLNPWGLEFPVDPVIWFGIECVIIAIAWLAGWLHVRLIYYIYLYLLSSSLSSSWSSSVSISDQLQEESNIFYIGLGIAKISYLMYLLIDVSQDSFTTQFPPNLCFCFFLCLAILPLTVFQQNVSVLQE